MEHKKPTPSTDQLAATRAAAWAWYQRGVGAEDTPVLEEVGVRRIQRVPKPSRFKLEAIASEGKPSARGSLEGRIWEGSDVGSLMPTLTEKQDYETSHSTNSLLDMYEIEMISKRFESLVCHAGDLGQHGGEISRQSSVRSERSVKNNKVKKKSSGFWTMNPSAVCGSGGVVEPMRLVRKHRQKARQQVGHNINLPSQGKVAYI